MARLGGGRGWLRGRRERHGRALVGRGGWAEEGGLCAVAGSLACSRGWCSRKKSLRTPLNLSASRSSRAPRAPHASSRWKSSSHLRMRCRCGADAVQVRCGCGAGAVRMRCRCGAGARARTVHVRRACGVQPRAPLARSEEAEVRRVALRDERHARHAVGPLMQLALSALGEAPQPRMQPDVLGVRLRWAWWVEEGGWGAD
jgi:hypothetical protein